MYIGFSKDEVVLLKYFLEQCVEHRISNGDIDCDELQPMLNLRQKLLDELKNA